MKKCPTCNSELKKILNKQYFPTGARGTGHWYFRAFELYVCPSCNEFFFIKKDLILAKPLNFKK